VKTSLRTIISFITIALALLGSLGFVVTSFITYSISSSATINDKAEITSSRLSNSLAGPLWDLDNERLKTVAASELDDDDIFAIVIRDDKGVALEAIERSYPAKGNTRANTHSLAMGELAGLAQRAYAVKTKDIMHGSMKIGDIAVYATNREVSRAFFSQLTTTVELSLGTSIGIALLLFFAIDRLVSNRILKLGRVVSRFSSRDFSARADDPMHDEIGALAQAFNRMAETIQHHEHGLQEAVNERTRQILDMEKFAFLGSLTAGVAHEVNTPLGVAVTASSNARALVASIAEGYKKGNLDELEFVQSLSKVAESLGIVEANLERAAEFIRSFKRMAVDQTADGIQRVKLKEYLDEIVLSLRPKLRKGKVRVSVIAPNDLELACSPGALYQIFTNLIVNSLFHAFGDDSSGNITITCQRDGSGLIMSYRDDGSGIAPGIIASIFEPFFTTKRSAGGSGLGLYIVKTTVAKMGGQIRCVSEPGKGVEFLITIPTLASSLSPVPTKESS
jgi:signal transduction histidine kinase